MHQATAESWRCGHTSHSLNQLASCIQFSTEWLATLEACTFLIKAWWDVHCCSWTRLCHVLWPRLSIGGTCTPGALQKVVRGMLVDTNCKEVFPVPFYGCLVRSRFHCVPCDLSPGNNSGWIIWAKGEALIFSWPAQPFQLMLTLWAQPEHSSKQQVQLRLCQ